MPFTNTDEYKILLSKIRSGECALILGPLFAITKEEKKVNELLKETLIKEYKVDLDTDYDNIFIAKSDLNANGRGVQLLKQKHKQTISSFYQDLQENIHETYQLIAQLNFNTILCFTQDDFMYNAFKATNSHCIFQYYRKPNASEKTDQSEKSVNASLDTKIPLVYNLYGYHLQQDSLIIDYNSFYEFFFVFIGDHQQAQLSALKVRLAKCSLFCFLGFDLKKWYVPIMLTKLLGIDNNQVDRAFAITVLDDTADRENANYMKWLQKYPMEINPIHNVSTVELIKEIFCTAETERDEAVHTGANHSLFRKRKQQIASSLSLNDAYNKVKRDPSPDALIETCEGLGHYLREANDNSNVHRLDLVQGDLSQLIYDQDKITKENFDIRMRDSREAIINIIHNKLGTV
ncbi:MAG: hypothetical protein JO154_12455 [Chitinophaga sp.]|uniref:SIR2 family protein n=1 Tax=Chitinophaga sp. TaxID=1869181 RepID=UPI0025BB3920|nr:SIR2 family protein [Chitinophaga sp.]MBV8253411.1 hypothetical protein [Chitinophaga sp.]